MDRILLTEDQLEDIFKRTIDAIDTYDKDMYLSLPSFTLCINHVRISYQNKDNILEVIYRDLQDDTQAKFGCRVPQYSWKTMSIPLSVAFHPKSDRALTQHLNRKVEKPFWLDFKSEFHNYQSFLLTYEVIQKSLLCLPTIWRKNKEDPSKKPLASGKTQRRTALLRNTYVYNSQYVPFRNYETYTCECWGVRGHIRHLKDGREIFIKPYKKGIKRDTIDEGKDYVYGKHI